MGFIGDRLKAAKAAEDYVKHIVYPKEVDPDQIKKAKRSLERTVYEGFMAGLKSEDPVSPWREFQGKFWAAVVKEGKQDDPDAARALENLKRAWVYGFCRARGIPNRPFGEGRP